jgi:hypothetical protein
MRAVFIVALAFAGCTGGGDTDPDAHDPTSVHSCTWAARGFCYEYDDRSAELGANVADAEAACLEDRSVYEGGWEPGEFSYEACDHVGETPTQVVARCVMPEEGNRSDGTSRAGQPAVITKYYHNGFDGTDYTTQPTALIGLKTECQIANEGVWQTPPFVDWDWTVAPRVESVDETCTPTADGSVWDYTITTSGLAETGGSASLSAASPDHGGEQHELAGDGTTFTVHIGALDEPNVYTCDDEPKMDWLAWIFREGAGHAAACGVWSGPDGDPTAHDPGGICTNFNP